MTIKTTLWSRCAVAALCVGALVAAACGGDDDDSSREETTETTAASRDTGAAPEPTGTPVKLGLVYSDSGRAGATYGSADNVAASWTEWVNTEMGGVNGHPVEVVAADSESTGEGALAAANELLADGVVGMVVEDSTAENAILDAVAGAGIPVIGGSANSRPQDSGDSHWPNTYFTVAPSNLPQAATSMVATSAVELENFSAAVCSEVPACAETGRLYEDIGPEIGVEYLGLVTVGASDPSYAAPCVELVGLGAEVIQLGITQSAALTVIDECQVQGFSGTFAAANNTVSAPDFEEVDELHLIGGINGFPWWADAEPAETFRSVVEDFGNGEDVRNPAATSTWATLELFRKAMTDVGPAADAEVTADDIVAAYHQIDGETLDGLLPAPISYVEEEHQPLVSCFWLFEMEDGEFSSISEGDSGNGASGDLQSTCFDGE